MAGKVTNGGVAKAAADLIADYAAGTLKLYQNNVTPSDTSTASDFTVCTFPGYANVSGPAFTAGSAAGGAIAIGSSEYTFLASAADAQFIYGYYLVDASNIVRIAEKFSGGPYAVDAAGKGIKLTVSQNVVG